MEKKKNKSAPKRKKAKTRSKRAKKSCSPKKKGEALFNDVVRMTGLPAKNIKNELDTILERKNVDLDKLTLDQLRKVAAAYLKEVMGGLLDRSSSRG